MVSEADSEHDQIIGVRAFGGILKPDAFLGRAPVKGLQEAVGMLVELGAVYAGLRAKYELPPVTLAEPPPPVVEDVAAPDLAEVVG